MFTVVSFANGGRLWLSWKHFKIASLANYGDEAAEITVVESQEANYHTESSRAEALHELRMKAFAKDLKFEHYTL